MKKNLIAIVILFALGSCNTSQQNLKVKLINEKFQTMSIEADNVDSPVFWKGNNGEEWIISTAKGTHQLIIDNAVTGVNIKRIGSAGSGKGQFLRPNGISVVDNLLFVVERDNHRVQVLSLPDFNSLGTFGDSTLIKPYGIYLFKEYENYTVFVTDNYEFEKDIIPADSLLGKRVQKFSVTIKDKQIVAAFIGYIGEIKGKGVLRVVESIFGDPENKLLLIAEEDTTQSSIKVYNLNGSYTGKNFGSGIFHGQVEGIALYDGSDGNGFWFITDQSYTKNTFYIFDRKTFELEGAFSGPNTKNTDGIWLTQTPFKNFPGGAFIAVNNDRNVSVFDLNEIMDILNK
ncbi:MAG: phytase [Bacteroidota bacterium]|jgi:3-phytase